MEVARRCNITERLTIAATKKLFEKIVTIVFVFRTNKTGK